MRQFDLSKVETPTEFNRLVSGGYVIQIKSVKDVTDKEYLEIEYDIYEGEFKGYYQKLYTAKNFWGGKTFKSYSEKGLPFFKAFIEALEDSNRAWTWNWNENILRGCIVGVIMGEEEYRANDNTIKTRLTITKFCSVEKIRQGEFVVPALKKIVQSSSIPAGLPPSGSLRPVNEQLPF